MAGDHAPNGSIIAPAALVAEDEHGDRLTAHTVLNRLGLRVVDFRPGGDPVALIVEQGIGLVLLDPTFPGMDVAGCVRRIRHDPRTARLPVVVMCPPTLDRERLRELITAGVSGAVLKPLSPDVLEQKLAPLVGQATTAARGASSDAEDDAGSEEAKTAARRVQDNNALLVRDVFCPCHTDKVVLRRYTLRTGHMVTETNFFDIVRYTAAAAKSDFVEFNRLGVIICPTCFFASNDPDYFPAPGPAGKTKPKTFSPAALAALATGTAERAALAAGASHYLFNHRRSAEDGLIAYQVALETSRVLHKTFLHEFPLEPLRLANYHLRLATLLKDAGGSDDQQAAHVAEAVPYLKEAFARMEGALLYKTVYQLVATGIYLGDDATAMKYLEHLRALERDKAHPPADGASLQRYLARCQEAWENRDYNRKPAPPEAAVAA